MQVDSPSHYRPVTPDSPLTSSLDVATSTIDDLTLALTNFSRVPSPEPQQQNSCCCGSGDCEATMAWLTLKSKLESRLVLSAEVGSALLQRHEAYVRRHERRTSVARCATQDTAPGYTETDQADSDTRVAELLQENATLEKRLTQALLNNEVAEASSKTFLHELEEARSKISRLNARYVRTVELDTRLSAVLQENDDIRQERDSQTQQAKLAEARLAALKDRTDKLQAQVHRLQDDLEVRRLQRLESSESLLQGVRSRLEGIPISHVTQSAADEDSAIIKVIESLVTDNEMLKADNEELCKLLTESREDLQALQRDVGEQGIAPPIRVETPSERLQTSSGPSSFATRFSSTRRPSSVESRSHHVYEPLTPETGRRPLSPDSLLASTSKYTSFIRPRPLYPPSHHSLDTNYEPYTGQGLLHPHQATKAIQTDRWLVGHSISQISSFADHSPHDANSDTSSLLDGTSSPMSSLLERMHSIHHRMTHADALTLTNRLKRQHLRGADVKHLSRTTVGNILSDVSHLRAQYRVWLEDEKMTTMWTRKDLRGLFKLFKGVLEEMGQMRVTLNDIILEPSVAAQVSEMAMDPAKAEVMEKQRKVTGTGIGTSWMTPFSKLFAPSSHDVNLPPSTSRTPLRPESRYDGNVRFSRPVPKTGPALAASATTVNVEFSGTGAGKSVTNIFSAHPDSEEAHGHLPSHYPSMSIQHNTHSIMGIFAGAPHLDDTSDPWVVLPRVPRRVQSVFLTGGATEVGTATVGRSSARKRKPYSLSRDVDAILVAPSVSPRSIEDSEIADLPGPLLERSLHRRGLSDSSIHSTFMNQRGCGNESNKHTTERGSVFQSLSRTVQNFKQAASHTISGVAHASILASDAGRSDCCPPVCGDSLSTLHTESPQVSPPTLTSLFPSLTSWAAGVTLDSTQPRSLHHILPEDSVVPRILGREGQRKDI